MSTPRDDFGDKIRAAEVAAHPTEADRRPALRGRVRIHRAGETGLFTDAFREVVAKEIDR